MRLRLLALMGLLASVDAVADDPVPIEQEPRHRLAFQNRHVRFFDVQLPPGYRSVVHIHHHDGVFVNIAPGETEAEDWGKAPVRRPPRAPGETYFIPYSRKPKAHRVSNVGESTYHVTDTEILQGCGGNDVPALPAGAEPALIDNEKVRVTRILLQPGETAPLHGPCGFLVTVTGGTARIDAPGGTELVTFRPAGFKWRDSDAAVSLTNVGTDALHAIDILVK